MNYLNIPNTLTLLNLACGLLAILFVVQGQLDNTIVALGLSLAFDSSMVWWHAC
ncbi:MAG: hypothetical protein R3B47_18065 [Bacteroidia bacterium]